MAQNKKGRKMNSGQNIELEFWEIQVSIARAAARSQEPSLAKLHYEVLEEIGRRPGLDIIDYFVKLAEIADEEVKEYFRFIGKSTSGRPQKEKKDPHKELADACARDSDPSVLKFRQAFISTFNAPPSEELISYFLEKVRGGGGDAAEVVKDAGKQAQLALAANIAGGPNATVLQLREAFDERFCFMPSPEIIRYFLDKKREFILAEKLPDDEYESKAHFAKTVAGGLVSTILQFRKAFEKAYGESPTQEIIEVFIRSLSRKKNCKEE